MAEAFTFEEASAPAEADQGFSFEDAQPIEPSKLAEGINLGLKTIGQVTAPVFDPNVAAASEGARQAADLQRRQFAASEALAEPARILNIITSPAVGAASEGARIAAPQMLAQDIQRATAAAGGGEVSLPIVPPGGDVVGRALGQGIQRMSKAARGLVADVPELYEAYQRFRFGLPQREGAEPGRNILPALRGETMPLEREAKLLPTPLRIAEQVAGGTIEAVPKIGGTLALESIGVPPPVAAGLIFGLTPQGFNVKQAAIAAALPYVGKYTGDITTAIAHKFGVNSLEALRMFQGFGGASGAAAYLGTIEASEIANLPPEQRKDAIIDAIANTVGQAMLGFRTELRPGLRASAQQRRTGVRRYEPSVSTEGPVIDIGQVEGREQKLLPAGEPEPTVPEGWKFDGKTEAMTVGNVTVPAKLRFTRTVKGQETTVHLPVGSTPEQIDAALKAKAAEFEPEKADVEALIKTQPGAVDPQALNDLSPEELAAYFRGKSGRQISNQYDGVLAGVHLTPDDVPDLQKMRDEAQKQALEAIGKNKSEEAFALMGKVTWLNGAIEGANKKGPNWDVIKGREQLEQAAYKHDDGQVHTGANHPEILTRLGIKGFEKAESRNTPQFGFRTKSGRFVEREEAARIAQITGQDLKKFEPSEPAHSDEISTPGQPTVPISGTGAAGKLKAVNEWFNTDAQSTARGALDRVRQIIDEHPDEVPTHLIKAAERYQQALEENFKMAGRGDVEGAEEAFLKALEKTSKPPKVKIGRGISARTRFNNETEAHGEDILSWIADNMPMLSKSQAQKQWSSEKWSQNKSQYDDAPGRLALPHHNIIFSEKGSPPNRVAQIAFEEGRIKEPHERALWAAIDTASKKRAGAVKGAKTEEARLKQESEQFDAWQKATSERGEKNNIGVTTEELKPGDVLEVEGQEIKVKSRDPDTGDLTLEDGRKFGTQVLEEGKRIYVEKFEEGPESTEFLPLGEGEPGGDLIHEKPLPQPTEADYQDRNKFIGEHYAGPPNSVVIQVRGLDTVPLGDGHPIVIPWNGKPEDIAPRLHKIFTEEVRSSPNGSMRESIAKGLDSSGRAIYHFEWQPERMRWARQADLEKAREEFNRRLQGKTLLPEGETERALTPEEQREFAALSRKAARFRETGKPEDQLTTEETQRYNYLSALAGQKELLSEGQANGAAQRIKALEKQVADMEKLRLAAQQQAFKSSATRGQQLEAVRAFQEKIAALRREIEQLKALVKASGNPNASTNEIFDVNDNADYTEVGQGLETQTSMTAASTVNGLPPGVKEPPANFAAELLEASRRLGTLIRTKITLLPRFLGMYSYSRAAINVQDKIEVADLRNTRTMAHEMGHDLDALLWPQVALAKTQKSLVPRAGSFGTIKELFKELVDVSILMRGPMVGSKGHIRYRKNSAELTADFFSLYAHDPDLARKMAPRFSKAFEAALARNPDAEQVIRELHAGNVKPVSPQKATGPTPQAAGMPGKVPARPEPPEVRRDEDVARAAEELVAGTERDFQSKVIGAQVQADNWRKVVPKAQDRNDAGAFIEGGGNLEIAGDTRDKVVARVSKNPAVQQFIKEFRLRMEDVREQINTYLRDFTQGEYLTFLQDYLPHLYVNSKAPAVGEAIGRWARSSPNAKQRKIPTLQEAFEMGLKPITQDPATLFEVWSRINWRVATNRRVVGELGNMKTGTGEPVLMPAGQAPPGYVRTDNPLIQRVYARQKGAATELWRGGAAVHPDAWRAVRMVLENPTSSTLGKAYDVLNSMARANAFAFSFFHDFTLTFASTGAQWRWYNPSRGLFRLFEKNPLTGELEIFRTTRSLGKELQGDETTVVDAALHGLKFSWNDSESYQYASRDYLEKAAAMWRGIPYLGKSAAFLRDLQHMRQKGLWKHTHDALKIAAYQDMVSKALAEAPASVNASEVKRTIASLLNDAFGGQEWVTKFWLSPQSRKVLSRFMLAPDWTLSTIRSVPGVSDVFATVRGQAPRIAGKEPIPVRLEGLQGNLGRLRFWKGELAAIAMATIAAQYAIYQAFGNKRKGDKPWMWENEYGQRTRIDVTPLMRKMPWHDAKDPTRYYVNLGKRPAEILSYFTDFDRIIAAKAARPVAELWKQITSTEGDFKAEWKRDHASFVEQLPGRAKSAGQAFLPFVFQGNQFALSFPYRKGMSKYKAEQAYQAVYELAAEPDKFASTTRTKATLRGVPMPEGTLKEMVRQIDDAALRNGVRAYEDIRLRALSTVRGRYLDAYFKNAYGPKPDQKAAEKSAQAYFNLGGTQQSLNQSVNRRMKLQPTL